MVFVSKEEPKLSHALGNSLITTTKEKRRPVAEIPSIGDIRTVREGIEVHSIGDGVATLQELRGAWQRMMLCEYRQGSQRGCREGDQTENCSSHGCEVVGMVEWNRLTCLSEAK